MNSSWKMWTLLLICVIICGVLMSCQPTGTQPTPEKLQSGDSEVHTKMGKKTLSKKQIIASANAVLRRHGENPRKYRVFYDEGNALWMRIIRDNPALADLLKSRLEGHDYQFLEYGSRERVGGLPWVIIDRNTGEELWFMVQS